MSEIKRFAEALKVHLRDRERDPNSLSYPKDKRQFAIHEAGSMGSTQTGEYGAADYVDWDALNEEIDKFAAEFAAARPPNVA